MLQNASNGSEQLEKIGLDEWISISRKQKWSEIGNLLQQYGSIGYYLGVLDNRGFKDEEKKMRELFGQVKVIPEKLIALCTQWMLTGCYGKSAILDYLKKNLLRGNEFPEVLNQDTKHHLITNELEQAKLLNWIFQDDFYKAVCSAKDRSVDDLIDKITGLHDSEEEASKRKVQIKRVADLLKANDASESENIKWLNKFDDALFKIKGKRLRDTQKMAILCAVEGEKRVLEQVNTGEGKSFIIAAIATIRIKTGKRFVYIITSSPVLAQRDSVEMTPLYNELGLTVAHNCSEDIEKRKKAYASNIIYGDMARFQRDHLLHTFYKKPIKGDRVQVAVIVDEVDNMLLDNGNNMLYLSHSVPGVDLMDSLLVYIQQQIYSPIYTGDKNDISTMHEQFDNSEIKKRVLIDLFGRFSIQDLSSLVKNVNFKDSEITAIYESLIKGDLIDSEGYLKIQSKTQLRLRRCVLE